MSSEADEILTVPEAAAVMKMSVRYVRRLIAERRIPVHRLGRSVRITRTDVLAHIEECRVEPMTASDVWRDLRGVA